MGILLGFASLSAQEAASPKLKTAILYGVVRESSGKVVKGAHVTLQGENLTALRETTTDAAGHFTFRAVAMGTFTLTATSGTSGKASISVTVSTPREQAPINVVLSRSGAQTSVPARRDVSQGMQFADSPDFVVAAVTDWTAAGGHGSDSILRASEALTRQTMNLSSGSAQSAPVAPPSGTDLRESENALRAAAARDPQGFDANFRLGKFYLWAKRYQDAIPPLQSAYRADPANYESEFDLALALKGAGDAVQARDHIRRLLERRSSADLHRMEGEIDEKLGDPLSAVRELQAAASENPSEDNYFAWGSELLYHRAIWQAKEVFDEGARLYPHSARMLTARGTALFSVAMYDDAALDLCRGSDLDPNNPEPYLFMGKIEVAAPDPLPCVVEKLARFEKLQPANSLADYYYAMALWKQQGHARDPQVMERVKAMLTRAVSLDPKLADGYLQLGNLSADQEQWKQAIGLYLSAIKANPNLSEAHYRLGVAYEHLGEQAKGKEQFQLHDEIARRQAAEIQRQRVAVKQFLVVIPKQTGGQQAP